MSDRDVLITTADGECDASLYTPSDAGPSPAVIMYPDAGGARATFRAMAQQLAELGYAVLLPNLYYRQGEFEPFDVRTVLPTQPNELD
jgi:carboxymethylenebutenolidase